MIWTQEYIRYRTNACNHATSVKNVFDQIDGGAIAAVCYVPPEPCSYSLSESPQNVPGAGGSFSVIAFRRSGDCDWTAVSESSFITLTTAAGSFSGVLAYTVPPNPGTARTGTIRVDWPGGSTQLVVNQAGPAFPVSFELFDFNQSANPTTECQIRLASHTCTLTATANLPAPIATYHWDVTYLYGNQKFKAQASANPTFGFLEACGQPSSSTEGTVQGLFVTLKVTDTAGNTVTINSGEGGQPALTIKFFGC